MKLKRIYLLTGILLIVGRSYALDYYVSPNGSNSNDGKSLAAPFQTIQKAADVAVFGDIVYVRAGIYREMVDIKSDGVTFQPYNGESVSINGTDLIISWSNASGNTYQANMNWDVDPAWGSNQLFSDGKMIEFARWPKQKSLDIVMPTNGVADLVTASGNYFIIKDNDFAEPDGRWVGAKIWVNLAHNGVDGQGWTGTVVSTSAGAHTITVDFMEPPRLGDQPWGVGQNTEFFLFDPTPTGVNSTGGVDALLGNGEWWKNGSTVYVKTPNGATPSLTGTGSNVIQSKRRHFAFWSSTTRGNYTIKDFNLFACSITTDKDATTNRIIVEAAHDIVIDGINAQFVSHQTDMTGNWQDQHYNWSGIVVSGRNNTIRNCTINLSATSALSVSGFGNKVLNNKISNTNYMCSNSGALNTGFVCQDAEIANNTIYNTTMMAINFRYSQNSNLSIPNVYRIHHNTIYDFMRRSGDSGAIDVFGQDCQWIRIDHNLIYNTTPLLGGSTHGIYVDFGGGANGDIARLNIDHNVVIDSPQPIIINDVQYVNIYNNVLMSNANMYSIVNGNGPTGNQGANVKIINNIMSNAPNVAPGGPGDLSLAEYHHNITNATGITLNTLFANAAGRNFQLISTATNAINQGVSIPGYDENVVGAPDLGAFEYGGSTGDTSNPSIPVIQSATNITGESFKLNWSAATDNIRVANYEVFINGTYYNSSPINSITVTGLTPTTAYSMTVRARDASGNRSNFSSAYNVNTGATTVPFITASSEYFPWDGRKENVFDGDLGSSWVTNTTSGWHQIQYPTGKVYNTYTIICNNEVDFRSRDLKTWTLKASNDGINYVTLDTRVNQAWSAPNEAKVFNFTNSTAYTYYAINFTENAGNAFTQVAEFIYSNTANINVTSVSLSPVTSVIAAPNTLTITPTVLPSNATDKSLNWSSNNPAVASVSQAGVVTGTTAGYATITARTNNGGYTASVQITVTASSVSVSGVTISPASTSIQVSKKSSLSAVVYPFNATDKSITWSSSNNAVAIVSTAGEVTGLTNGTVTITVTTVNGSFSASSSVNIVGPPPLAGTAYRWSNNSSATSNNNKFPSSGLNDGNTTIDVPLNNGYDDNGNAYEAAGLTFSTAQNVTKVEFVQGTYGGSFDNGSFESVFAIQTSSNGSSWQNAPGWTVTPTYQFLSPSITGITYTFTGNATNIKGIRVYGRVHTNAYSGSWEARCREIRAFSSSGGGSGRLDIAETADDEFDKSVALYPNPASSGITVLTPGYDESEITIITLEGKQITARNAHSESTEINVSDFVRGFYFLKVRTSGGVSVKKLMIAD